MNREEQIAKYDAIVAEAKGCERLGKTMPYTSSNGYMYSQVNKAGEIGIRLSKERQKELNESHELGPFKSYGATMKDYVMLSDEIISDEAFACSLLEEGLAFVNSLPPK